MLHLNEDFKKCLSPASWKNKVSAFLNNLCGDGLVKVERPDRPSSSTPPRISLDVKKLTSVLAFQQENVYPLKVRIGYDGNNRLRLKVYLGTTPSKIVRFGGVDYSFSAGVSADADGWYFVTPSAFISFTSTVELWLVENTASGAAANSLTFSNAALSGTNKSKLSVLIARIQPPSTNQDGIVYQNYVGAMALQNAYLGKGASNVEVGVSGQPSSGTLWDRDSTQQLNTDKNNFVCRQLVSFQETADAYCYRLHFLKFEFDRDGRLYKVSRDTSNAYVDLVDYEYINDLG